MAKFQNIRAPGTLPLVVVGNLLDGPVVLVGVLGQEAGVLLVGHQEADPHYDVDHDEGVVGLRQRLIRDRNTLKINK